MAARDVERDHDPGARAWSLSPTEFRLLLFLMENAGRVLSQVQILDHVLQYGFGCDESIVESYNSYLRRKMILRACHKSRSRAAGR